MYIWNCQAHMQNMQAHTSSSHEQKQAYFEQGHAAISATIQIQHKSEIQNWIQILATRFQTHLAPTDAQETYLQASIKTSLFPRINWSCKLAIVPWWCSGALVITEIYLHIQRFHWLTMLITQICSNKSSTNWTWLLVGGTTRQCINPTPEGSNSPVDTVFWHVSKKVIFVKRRWLIWKKPKDAQCWNRPMESVRWTRGICREDADLSVLVFGR